MAARLQLVEEEACLVDTEALGATAAMRLHQQFSRLVALDFPNPAHPRHYRLRSRGWVGNIDLDGLCLELQAKVPLANVFGMVEEAYGLEGMLHPAGRVRSTSLPGVFASLALLLARRVGRRLRQGLYREYCQRDEVLQFARGRLLPPSPARPGGLRCVYPESSADIPDNQLLYGVLQRLRTRAFPDPQVRRELRQVCRQLAGTVRLRQVLPDEFLGRTYHRLNRDYEPLHALCRFFLDHAGPALGWGATPMMPFAVHLPTLFERFVAAWLARRLPAPGYLECQHRAFLEGGGGLAFRIDLVLRHGPRGRPLAVLDTKYRRVPEAPAEDVQQVVAYAVRLGAPKAFLIYPADGITRRLIQVGPVSVEVWAFPLDGDLAQGGSALHGALVEVLMSHKQAYVNPDAAQLPNQPLLK